MKIKEMKPKKFNIENVTIELLDPLKLQNAIEKDSEKNWTSIRNEIGF